MLLFSSLIKKHKPKKRKKAGWIYICLSTFFFVPAGQGTNENIEPEPIVDGGADEEAEGPGERPVIAKAFVWLINPFARRDGEQKPPLSRIFEKFSK